MIVIGLTGGIGAGKSTVSDFLKKGGYLIIDADDMARKMTVKGSKILDDIAKVFGTDILLADGSLNRKKLASVVFSDEEKKKQLENLTTRKVIGQIESKIEALREADSQSTVFVDAPLLFESGADRFTDYIWLVTADLPVRIDRVVKRDQTTEDAVLARIRSQMSDEDKAKKSTDIIDNSKGKEELYLQIENLLEKYEKLL